MPQVSLSLSGPGPNLGELLPLLLAGCATDLRASDKQAVYLYRCIALSSGDRFLKCARPQQQRLAYPQRYVDLPPHLPLYFVQVAADLPHFLFELPHYDHFAMFGFVSFVRDSVLPFYTAKRFLRLLTRLSNAIGKRSGMLSREFAQSGRQVYSNVDFPEFEASVSNDLF